MNQFKPESCFYAARKARNPPQASKLGAGATHGNKVRQRASGSQTVASSARCNEHPVASVEYSLYWQGGQRRRAARNTGLSDTMMGAHENLGWDEDKSLAPWHPSALLRCSAQRVMKQAVSDNTRPAVCCSNNNQHQLQFASLARTISQDHHSDGVVPAAGSAPVGAHFCTRSHNADKQASRQASIGTPQRTML